MARGPKRRRGAALPLWSSRHLTWRTTLIAAALAFSTFVPFLLWDAPALGRGVVRHHLDVPLRANSLCVPAAVVTYTGWQMPGAVGFAAALVTAVLAFARRLPSLAQATLGGMAVVLAFFLFGKGGHLNYYWFAGSLLPMTLLGLVRVPREPATGQVAPSWPPSLLFLDCTLESGETR